MPGDAPQELQEAIVTALRADATLQGLLGTLVVQETVEPDTPFPYMVIYGSAEEERDSSDTEGEILTYEFHVYTNLNDTNGAGNLCRSVAKSLRRLLSAKGSIDFPMTNTKLLVMRFQSKRDVRDGAENVYRSIITYRALTAEK